MKKLNYRELKEAVENYKTKHDSGFTREEQLRLCDELGVNKSAYLTKLGVNTCLLIGNEYVTYHCDVLSGLNCVMNDVELKWCEWD